MVLPLAVDAEIAARIAFLLEAGLFQKTLGRRIGRTCSSATSSKEEMALVALKWAKSSPLAVTQSGMAASPGSTTASGRTRFSSSCRSAGGRLGLKGSTVAVQQMATFNNAASGPR
jgi:hypothetical protein